MTVMGSFALVASFLLPTNTPRIHKFEYSGFSPESYFRLALGNHCTQVEAVSQGLKNACSASLPLILFLSRLQG